VAAGAVVVLFSTWWPGASPAVPAEFASAGATAVNHPSVAHGYTARIVTPAVAEGRSSVEYHTSPRVWLATRTILLLGDIVAWRLTSVLASGWPCFCLPREENHDLHQKEATP
jgi:hypothetical protein